MKCQAALAALVLAAILPAPAARAHRPPRNVVLMVADGAGYNTWLAKAAWEGRFDRPFPDGPGWVRLACSTEALRFSKEPMVSAEKARTQAPSLAYDPARAWDVAPAEGGRGGRPFHFEGYRWLRLNAPDSANTASTLVSGVRTYEGAINVDGSGAPLPETLAELAHRTGRRVGVVTSVPFSHATPAAASGVHSASRSDYCSIAVSMLTASVADVLMGAGHPDFDNNGESIADPERRTHRYVGGRAVWDVLTGRGELAEGDAICAESEDEARPATAAELDALRRWTLVETREAVEALERGPTPDRLLAVPRAGERLLWTGRSGGDDEETYTYGIGATLQQRRGSRTDPRYTAPGDDPLVAAVPSMESLTRAALNALDDDPDGLFLLVEGGAVDWAMHANQLGRMIEEMQDFEAAMRVVENWVETHGGWRDTLLVVTSDHDHLLWGPKADEAPFHPLEDRGIGKLPGYRWLSNGHSAQLVPVLARGAGAARLRRAATRTDPFRGPYVDQVDVHELLRRALTGRTARASQ